MLDILLVDDEPTIRLSVGDALEDAGHRVTLAADGQAALDRVAEQRFDLVITDIRMPGLDGLSLFRRLRESAPETDVILITAYGAVDDAVAALKQGARDYLQKPFDTGELLVRVERVAERHALGRALADARRALAEAPPERSLIGRSPPMTRLADRIETFAATDAPVLILGESGTGKELVARELHRRGPRTARPFVAVHCAAFPETLIEAELFGHERGAFTGAVRRREGRFRAADGGTLFLDEIAEIPLPAQAKLLRVLQEGTFEPLGQSTPVHVDVRILSATHRDLKQCVAEGTFREDLYYRLRVLDVRVPPLRDRAGDLPLLVEHFLARFAGEGKPLPEITPAAWHTLTRYAYPGNVRELEHAVHHAVVLSRGAPIERRHLPEDIIGDDPVAALPVAGPAPDFPRPLADAVGEFERAYLVAALRHNGGLKAQTAEALGISRKNLWEKLRRYAVDDSEFA